jgi:hypothetical protein
MIQGHQHFPNPARSVRLDRMRSFVHRTIEAIYGILGAFPINHVPSTSGNYCVVHALRAPPRIMGGGPPLARWAVSVIGV